MQADHVITNFVDEIEINPYPITPQCKSRIRNTFDPGWMDVLIRSFKSKRFITPQHLAYDFIIL